MLQDVGTLMVVVVIVPTVTMEVDGVVVVEAVAVLVRIVVAGGVLWMYCSQKVVAMAAITGFRCTLVKHWSSHRQPLRDWDGVKAKIKNVCTYLASK